MSYIRTRFRSSNAIEVEEYYPIRSAPPGAKRAGRRKPTPEQMKEVNRKNREKTCRRKLRTWFRVNDYFTTLTYSREHRPRDMTEAKEHFKRFYTVVRREYRKRGYELRWIRNIEVGTKGAWHVHMVINRIPDTDIIVAGAWKHGMTVNKLIHERGEFRELAAYLTKTPDTDKRLKESHYWTSRNLPIPPPKKKEIKGPWQPEKIRVPKGFYLDQDSYYEGVNPVTGHPHREYTLIRIKRKEPEDEDSRYIYRDKPKRSKKRSRKGHVPDEKRKEKR